MYLCDGMVSLVFLLLPFPTSFFLSQTKVRPDADGYFDGLVSERLPKDVQTMEEKDWSFDFTRNFCLR